MTAADRYLPEPYRAAIVRTSMADGTGGAVWQCLEQGLWFTHTTAPGELPIVKNWAEVVSGTYGTVVELLVPVPYDAPEPGTDGAVAVDRLVHHVLTPVANMLQQVTAAAASGLSALVVEADRRGYRRAANQNLAAIAGVEPGREPTLDTDLRRATDQRLDGDGTPA